MKTLPVALQVYSVRDAAAADFAGTMLKIKAMGYDGVELAGLYGLSAAEVKQAVDAAGLRIISAHVPYAEMLKDIDAVIATYQYLGCDFIAVPYLDNDTRPGSAGFAEALPNIARFGAACQAKGLTLLYHNHDFEFITMADGSFGLDYIYAQTTPGQLQTELDTCWVKVAGQDPVAYINKYAGRCPVVHLKDFYKSGLAAQMYELIGIKSEAKPADEGVFEFRPLGQGLQNFPPILAAAVQSGAQWVVVEQDRSVGRTPLEAVEMSRAYLKELGW